MDKRVRQWLVGICIVAAVILACLCLLPYGWIAVKVALLILGGIFVLLFPDEIVDGVWRRWQ